MPSPVAPRTPPPPVSEPSVDTTTKEAPGPETDPVPVKATLPETPSPSLTRLAG